MTCGKWIWSSKWEVPTEKYVDELFEFDAERMSQVEQHCWINPKPIWKRDGMNTYVSLGWVNGLMSPATLWLTITQVRTSDWTLAWLTWNNHRDHRRMEMNDLTGKISQGMSSYLMLFDCFREGIPVLLQQCRHWKLRHLMFSDLFPLQTPPWVVLCVSSELWGYPDGQPDGGLGSWISDVLSHSLDDFGCVFWIRIILCSASGRQYFLAGHHLHYNLGCYYKKAWGRRQLSHVVPNFFGDFWQVGKFHGALSYLRRALKLEASSGLVELWTKLPQLGKFDLCHVAGSKISRTCWKPQWMVHSCWVSHPFWTAHIHWWYQKANNDRACTMIRWLTERIQYNSNGTYISDREHMIYDN